MALIRTLFYLILLLFLVVACLAVYLATQDITHLAKRLEKPIEDRTGRSFTVEGPVRMLWGAGEIGVSMKGARVGNADWASEEPLADVGTVRVRASLSTLFGGRPDIREIHLEDVVLLLERGPDGAANWVFGAVGAAPSAAGTGAPMPLLRQLTATNVQIRYSDAAGGRADDVRIEEALLVPAEGGLDLDLTGRLNGAPLVATGRVDALEEFAAGGLTGVSFDLALAGAEFTVTGDISDFRSEPVDLEITAAAPDIAPVAAALNPGAAPPSGPLTAELLMRGTQDAFLAEPVELTLGEGRLEGRLEGSRSGEILTLDGAFHAPLLDLDALSALAPASEGSKSGPMFSSETLPLDTLKTLAGAVALTADRLVFQKVAYDDVEATLQLGEAALVIEPFVAHFQEAPARGSIKLDASGATPTADLALAIQGLDLEAFASAYGQSSIVGAKLDADIAVQGTGTSVAGIMDTLGGKAEVLVEDGSIGSGLINFVAADLIRAATEGGSGRTELKCFVNRYDIDGGVATVDVLLMDTDLITMTGAGSVDLGAETIDLKLAPRPKDTSLLSLATDYNVTGSLRAPQVAPDALSVAKGVAGAIGSVTVLGGVGYLAPLISGGSDEQDLCAAALSGELKEEKGAAGKAGDAVKDVGKGIGEGIKGLFD